MNCKGRWLFTRIARLGLVLAAASAVFPASQALADEAATLALDSESTERRLAESIGYLASDELEGRGLATQGLKKAAEHIAGEFNRLGLKTDLFNGEPFQKFPVVVRSELGPVENNVAALVTSGAEGKEEKRTDLKIGQQIQPLAIGGSAKFDLPLVFVGYGITAPDMGYDDYANLDVRGKAVLVLRKEPQQTDPHSKFSGSAASPHATFMRKLANAYEHGAEAVVFVNDHGELSKQAAAAEREWSRAVQRLTEAHEALRKLENPMSDEAQTARARIIELAEQIAAKGKLLAPQIDQVLEFSAAGSESTHLKTPVFFAARDVFDALVKEKLGDDLATIERKIDEDLTPRSAELSGVRLAGETQVIQEQAEIMNVAALLPGEGPRADETIVLGAHYDHLGRGESGTLAPWTKDIHNGADDNASGVAALLETARRLAASKEKPGRSILFVAFTGEERGLLGSAQFVREPPLPLERIVAMVNMDMVGRLNEEKLVVYGTGTATEFDPLIDELGKQYGFTITKEPGGFGPSDHSSFYAKKIPVLHLFTGTHSDYHRPSDDSEKINVPGMRRVTEMVVDTVSRIAAAEGRPTYLQTGGPRMAGGGGDRPYFGSIPDFSQQTDGYALQGVADDSPASRGGLKAGDVIIKLGDSRIGGLEDFDSALRKFKPHDKVPVVVRRDEKEVTLTVELDPPR
jgi:hypothetical protein